MQRRPNTLAMVLAGGRVDDLRPLACYRPVALGEKPFAGSVAPEKPDY